MPQTGLSLTKSRINLESRLALYLQERIPHKGESGGSIKRSKKRQKQEKAGALELQVHTLPPKANS